MSVEVHSVKNESETALIAKNIASEIKGGGLITLDGDLGAGKTFFTGALCEALGLERKSVS
ncbi:MAG TPA: tRNA (adenosine(37)-N6)-threonylcarbamoyltransferase complex ATPase subunit type 1 TsaE, partial [bacterium]|nr:tRNA (adenosine(37)-N6)-threonylcarbamoyltransferase complex ATPase subunit type 1 TsaE [bacterium]